MKTHPFIASNAQLAISVSFDLELALLEVEIPVAEGLGSLNIDESIEEIEIILQRHKDLTMVFKTLSHGESTMQFMHCAIKMIERYQWLEGNEVKLHWIERSAIGTRASIKEQLLRRTDTVLKETTASEYGIYTLS